MDHSSHGDSYGKECSNLNPTYRTARHVCLKDYTSFFQRNVLQRMQESTYSDATQQRAWFPERGFSGCHEDTDRVMPCFSEY